MKPIKPKRVMNATEARFADQLEMLKRSEQIIDWRFEALRFRLSGEGAKKVSYYKPDFLAVYPSQFVIYEVKGHWREAARARIKIAAGMYPWFMWVAVQWKNKEWVFEFIN